MNAYKILMLSTVHVWNDVRIFHREFKSLLSHGFDIELVAVEGKEQPDLRFKIRLLHHFANKLLRIVFGNIIAIFLVLKMRPKIIHFHDPELVPSMFLLSFFKKIIFDIHENLHEGLKEKSWIPFKSILLPFFFGLEKLSIKKFHLVLAEASYEKFYKNSNKDFAVVQNFPDYPFFTPYQTTNRNLEFIQLLYVGGVSTDRGIISILKALEILQERNVKFKFHCVGPIQIETSTSALFIKLTEKLNKNVIFYGRLNLDKAYEISRQCNIGVAILKPISNYIESYPTKLFEYMAIGLPFITSNFSLYQQLVIDTNAGICIDPLDSTEIAQAMLNIISDKNKYLNMAKNGINAVSNKYNWESESNKLVTLYNHLLLDRK